MNMSVPLFLVRASCSMLMHLEVNRYSNWNKWGTMHSQYKSPSQKSPIVLAKSSCLSLNVHSVYYASFWYYAFNGIIFELVMSIQSSLELMSKCVNHLSKQKCNGHWTTTPHIVIISNMEINNQHPDDYNVD